MCSGASAPVDDFQAPLSDPRTGDDRQKPKLPRLHARPDSEDVLIATILSGERPGIAVRVPGGLLGAVSGGRRRVQQSVVDFRSRWQQA